MTKTPSEKLQSLVKELTQSPENVHTSFMSKNEELAKNKLVSLLGKTTIITGVIFALAGIGDIITNGGVSEFVRNTGLPLAENLANLPLFLKMGGGSSLIATGSFIENQATRK